MKLREEAVKSFRSQGVGKIIGSFLPKKNAKPEKHFSEDVERPPVGHNISKKEFLLRYRNARFTGFVPLILFVVAFVQAILADSKLSFALMMMSSMFLLFGYFIFSFTLWKARMAWACWGKVQEKLLTLSDYIDAISVDYKQILPIKIK